MSIRRGMDGGGERWDRMNGMNEWNGGYASGKM